MFLLGLIWVQTVCESYQQMALGDKKLPLTMLNLNISHFVNRVNPEQSYSEKTADKDTHCISLCLQIQANYWNLAGKLDAIERSSSMILAKPSLYYRLLFV